MVNLGLIGRHLEHSYSPDYFYKMHLDDGAKGSYKLFELQDISEFPDLIASHPELNGLNVTVPYKESVIQYLDELSEDARALGAVNVIRITHGVTGKPCLKGYNTDWKGFLLSVVDIMPGLQCPALVLGTGGAAKAVGYALKKNNHKVTFVSRGPEGKADTIGYNDITSEMLEEQPLVVNATPAGMYPDVDSMPPFPCDCIHAGNVCVDLIYNPGVTAFMRECAVLGATVKNGIEMLHIQANLAWKIWTSEFLDSDMYLRT